MATEVALKVTADGSQAANSVKELKEQLKQAQSEAKKIAKEFGESSDEALAAAEKVKQLGDQAAKVQEPVKSFKQQLKEAQAEVIAMSEKFGATSREAALAAQKAANLKDAIGDAKALTDVFSPDQKFQAFAGAIQGVIGGFQALQGAQALFGSESEEVEKVLVRLQAAMNLSQGLNSITSSIDSFKNLKSFVKETTIAKKAYQVATVAAAGVQKLFTGAVNTTSASFKGLRSAIISTGIGALVIGITMLISKISDWVSGSDDAEAAQEELNTAIERQNALLEESQKALDFERQAFERRAKIQGLSQQQILKQQVDFNKKEVALLANDLKTKLDLRKKAFYDENIDAEAFNKIKEETNKSQQALQDAINKTKLSELDIEANAAEEQRNIAKKRNEDSKRAHEKRLSDSKAAADKAKQQRQQNQQEIDAANKAAADATKKLEDEIFLQKIKDDDERAKARLKLEYENTKKEIEQSKANESIKQKELAALKQKFDLDNAALDAQIKEKKAKDDLEKQNEIDKALMDARLAAITDENVKKATLIDTQRDEEIQKQADAYNKGLIDLQTYNNAVAGINADFNKQQADLTKQIQDKEIADKKAAEEAKQKLDDETFQNKMAINKAIGDSMGQLSEIIGKETAVGKGLAVAQATMNTYMGATEVLRAKSTLPEPIGTISKIVNVAAIIATGIKSVKAILATKVPGGGGGGGTPPSMPTAPLTPQVQTTNLNQGQINQLASATSRAFVLESDVSGSQERIKRINRAARIN